MAQGRRAALVVAVCLAVARAETASTQQLSDPDVMEMDAIEAMTERSAGRRLQFGLDPNNEPLAGLGKVISQKYSHQVGIQPAIPCTLPQRFAWGSHRGWSARQGPAGIGLANRRRLQQSTNEQARRTQRPKFSRPALAPSARHAVACAA
jgi:hypothetical protein